MKLMKKLTIITNLACVAFLTLTQSVCIHDRVRSRNVLTKELSYGSVQFHDVVKREASTERADSTTINPGRVKYDDGDPTRGPPSKTPPGFNKIRIYVDFHDLDIELDRSQENLLRDIIEDAVFTVTDIFSVKPVVGDLLLSRSAAACAGEWQNGPNVGKCSKLANGYDGETCLDGFKIPEKHLEGLAEWGYSSSQPTRVYAEDGRGVPDADYVLYVRASTTNFCTEGDQNVIAYASYCHQDQNSRPISGVVNVCPELLKKSDCDVAKTRVTALHEIFHALGFSEELFDQFRDCSGGSCEVYRDPVRHRRGVPRLVTPHVVERTSRHFNCLNQDSVEYFGPILEQEDDKVKSHWDAAFMQGSIMAPTIGLAHLTRIDAITLALFEDTGWYGIDYRYAEPYEWGRDAGCNFAMGSCDSDQDRKYFCENSDLGCHYMHYDKGRCETDRFLYGCRVYKARPKDTCSINIEGSLLPGEVYRSNSRCFISDITFQGQTNNLPLEGRCYQHRCIGKSHQEVKLNGTGWYDCPSGEHIEIPGYEGVVICPDLRILCQPPLPPRGHGPPPNGPPHAEPESAEHDLLCVEMLFRYEFRKLLDDNLLKVFKKEVSSEISFRTRCAAARLRDIDIYDGEKSVTIYRFNLLPAESTFNEPTSDRVFEILAAHVAARNFTIFLPQPVSAEDIRLVPVDPTESSEGISSGVIAGIVIALAVIAVIIGILVFYVQRYYALQSRTQQSFANYPSALNTASSSSQERRGSSDSGESADCPSGSGINGSYSDLASYHSDIESYPVSSGRFSSNRGSLHSQLSGVDNYAYSLESKGSVTSSCSYSKTPSITYVSTINVKETKKLEDDRISVKERVKALNSVSTENLHSDEKRKISSSSDDNYVEHRPTPADTLPKRLSDTCNDKVPHREEDEITVTTIGIRDRTSSEITISTIRANFLRQKLAERMRVKSQDDVNVKPPSLNGRIPALPRTRLLNKASSNRDSFVTISTVSSKDRSMSDVTISTLSKNSVYMGSNGCIPNGKGETNLAYLNDETPRHRLSDMTQSTMMSAEHKAVVGEDENDSVFSGKNSMKKGSNSVKKQNDDNKSEAKGEMDIKQRNTCKSLDRNGIENDKDSVANEHLVANGINGNTETNVNEGNIYSQKIPITNGFDHSTEIPIDKGSSQENLSVSTGIRDKHCSGKSDPKGTMTKLHRTGSVQSQASEVSCIHNHSHTHINKSHNISHENLENAKHRSSSSSSESSLSSNACSECDSCPYCMECASVLSEDISESAGGKFISVINTENFSKDIRD